MRIDQLIALAVLAAVVIALIWGRVRADVVALAGAAVLLGARTIRPVEVQGAFASPALLALASLFVIVRALETSGLLEAVIVSGSRWCRRVGPPGVWIIIVLCGCASAFMNNTPLVLLAAPIVRDLARSVGASERRFLIPLSYATILGGSCTLIGTSTNLLVNDMARNAGQPAFTLFEMTPVALLVAAADGLFLTLVGAPLLGRLAAAHGPVDSAAADPAAPPPAPRVLHPLRAALSVGVFGLVIAVSALGYAPIAAAAFAGAVALILMGVISPDEAYAGLKPEVLLLIAGMVVIGLALQVTGLAAVTTQAMANHIGHFGPAVALALLIGATTVLTEMLSNAAVAVLVTPVAVALAQTLGVSPRPFLVGVMVAASAAFATPFGYQTNVLVYHMGRYRYLDFVKVGLPLNLLTWAVSTLAIPVFFPF